MPRGYRSRLVNLLAAFVIVALAAAPAAAQSLDALRASGAVGERFDGYAVARDASAAAVVNQINAKRKQVYTQRAASQGVPVDQVGRVYAQQILQKAPPGTYFQKPDGSWVRK
ncbi:MAG: YdbL family protein [Kiloniellaceae bacterium]